MKIKHDVITLKTGEGMSIHNITPTIQKLIEASGISNGLVVVCSRHTTTALAINEFEERLLKDIERYFGALVPSTARYFHNDIHLRDCPPNEPENAHSHIIAMLLGSSESIPLVGGKLALGQWQSVKLIELDGPRDRQINVQILGE